MSKPPGSNAGTIVVFALFVASLVYHAAGVNERVQQSRQPAVQRDLPQVRRWQWPAIEPPRKVAAPVAPRRDLFR